MKISIGKLCVGEGEPPLLIGSVLYHGDKCVKDYERGEVDWLCVENALSEALDACDRYGVNLAIDLVVENETMIREAFPKALDVFKDLAIFIDAPSRDLRVKLYSFAKELGASKRCVASGLTIEDVAELDVVKENGLGGVLVLVYDPKDSSSIISIDKRLAIARLLVNECRCRGLEPLLDIIVMDPSSIAISSRAMELIKRELDAVVGCAPSNALGFLVRSKHGDMAVAIQCAVSAYLRMKGADFVMYGPLRRAKFIVPAIAVVDVLERYAADSRSARKALTWRTMKTLQQIYLSSSRGESA